MSGMSAFRRRWAAIRREGGFTLIELMVVMVLIGITTAMFEETFSAFVNRSSQVQAQNISQTEVRAGLNQLVSDVRDASPGDATNVPFVSMPTTTQMIFYSPDRLNPFHMRRIKYWVNGTTLMRQVTTSTNTSTTGPPWTGITADTGPIWTLFGSIQNPTSIPVFKYCTQTPRDMALDTTNSPTSPLPITWACSTPSAVANVKTVIVNAGIAANPSSPDYYYGAVATLRWNAS